MFSLSCFLPEPALSLSLSPHPNLTTYTYHTEYGAVSLTWSRSMLGRSLHVDLHEHSTFRIRIKPWKKHGSRKLSHNTLFLWNLSHARFGPGPQPLSRFYVALLVDHSLSLLVGDQAPKPKPSAAPKPQLLVLKRDHVHVAPHCTRVYQTTARLGGKLRDFHINCDGSETDALRLWFCVDQEKVLEVTRLNWKFRGSQRVEIDGSHVQISWDVHDWLFDNNKDQEGHAVFMFKFEDDEVREREEGAWTSQQQWSLGSNSNNSKSFSSSSFSLSSSAGSSVMEWSSLEENHLLVPLGFSLLVYASRT